VASSTSMMGMSSFTEYTRWHSVHFKLSGFCRYSRACRHAGQTRISSNSFAIMEVLYATKADPSTEYRVASTELRVKILRLVLGTRYSVLGARYCLLCLWVRISTESKSMPARILDGTKIASDIRREVAAEVQTMTAAGVRPGLAVVLAGHNPASEIYVRGKVKACEEVGIYGEQHTPAESATTSELLALIEELNRPRRD